MSVYSTMLEHMSDEQKISVTAKLAQEVLSAAIDGGLPLTGSNSAAFSGGGNDKQSAAGSPETRKKASAVVKDALTIMASPGIRVGGGRGGGAGAADLDDGAGDETRRLEAGWRPFVDRRFDCRTCVATKEVVVMLKLA